MPFCENCGEHFCEKLGKYTVIDKEMVLCNVCVQAFREDKILTIPVEE